MHRDEFDCICIEPVCENGTIRLSPDGPSSNEGRVEICYQNVWGAVYDPNWSEFDAAVVCSQLNFDRSSKINLAFSHYTFL